MVDCFCCTLFCDQDTKILYNYYYYSHVGYSVKHATSIFMEYSTGYILHVENGTKGNSGITVGGKRTL